MSSKVLSSFVPTSLDMFITQRVWLELNCYQFIKLLPSEVRTSSHLIDESMVSQLFGCHRDSFYREPCNREGWGFIVTPVCHAFIYCHYSYPVCSYHVCFFCLYALRSYSSVHLCAYAQRGRSLSLCFVDFVRSQQNPSLPFELSASMSSL